MSDAPISNADWPFDITDEQKSSLWRKWNQDGQELTFQEFVDTIQPTSHMDGAIVVQWSGMFLAIEKDGYTHS